MPHPVSILELLKVESLIFHWTFKVLRGHWYVLKDMIIDHRKDNSPYWILNINWNSIKTFILSMYIEELTKYTEPIFQLYLHMHSYLEDFRMIAEIFSSTLTPGLQTGGGPREGFCRSQWFLPAEWGGWKCWPRVLTCRCPRSGQTGWTFWILLNYAWIKIYICFIFYYYDYLLLDFLSLRRLRTQQQGREGDILNCKSRHIFHTTN